VVAAHLDWPFFGTEHRSLAPALDAWSRAELPPLTEDDVDAACRARVAALGAAGWLRHCVPAQYGGASEQIDSRALCLVRETLAWHDGLADFAFAMQGLGSGSIALAGTDEQRSSVLPRVAQGTAIMAFALSEPAAGSDVAALGCTARRTAGGWQIDGEKAWISNGGIADFYTVFARTGEPGRSTRGISAFLVAAATPGLTIAERIVVTAPHPLARLSFEQCQVPGAALIGVEGEGFKLAMATLDIFRASVAAAALGFGQRALDEAITYARERPMFGAHLADLQLTRARLADMATALDAARLLTYRAAWLRDVQYARGTMEAAMAKMAATESAQQVIDAAVQLFGARGVQSGSVVERLYREIRALRIYEGATEVQKLVIARELLAS
jgi:alkylation response protein AidB-like acyl-CoA dehydrogenase